MGRPKASVELAGMTLKDRAVAILHAVRCEPIVVADHGDDGPLAALLAPLEQLEGTEVFVLACDLPLTAPVVARLAALAPGPAIAVDPDGRVQPLCARWPLATARDAVRRIVESGERRMSALVDAMNPELVVADADELLNVNTPEDLERARQLLTA